MDTRAFKYDPNEPVDAEVWLSLDEEDKHAAILDYHDLAGIEPPPSPESHAILHAIVEEQIAEDAPEVRKTLARLMDEGLNRHQAVHAVACVANDLVFEMCDWEVIPDQKEVESIYAKRLSETDAETWLSIGEGTEPSARSERDLPAFPDLRSLEGVMGDIASALGSGDPGLFADLEDDLDELQFAGRSPGDERSNPLDEAQDLMYAAWDEPVPEERIRLAEEALRMSADCADAYVLLAEDKARTLEEAESFYQQGLAAGERALGSDYFEQETGHFWGMLETRPYMRAPFWPGSRSNGNGEELGSHRTHATDAAPQPFRQSGRA